MLTTIALFLPAIAPVDPLPGGDAPVAFAKRVGDQTTAYVELLGPAGAPYALFAQEQPAPFDFDTAWLVADGFFDGAGYASAAIPVPNAGAMAPGTTFTVAAAYADLGQIWQTEPALLPMSGSPNSLVLDFEFAPGFDEPVAGQPIDDEYVDVGITINAINKGGGPDLAIIFDSSNPTGDDDDLATPGPGAGNDTAYGNLLIVAENDIDGDGDGLVDIPDDERDGGLLIARFDPPVDLYSLTVVDVDDVVPSEVRFLLDGAASEITIPLVDVGDNGVQTLLFEYNDVTRMTVDFGGSGAIAEVGLLPCLRLDFDEATMGEPLDLPAGTVITDQFQSELGLTISVDSGDPFGPDKGIIFDSGNPTGGDTDLATPGYGVNNDTFLGNLLIIAEDDVDISPADGLVDDPDDAQFGGTIDFKWDHDVIVDRFTVIDVDSEEFDFLFLYDEFDNLILQRDLGPIGDNSVQTFAFDGGVPGVRRAALFFAGSGGVDNFRWCVDDEDEPQPEL